MLGVVARLDWSEAVEPEVHLTFETWEAFFRTVTASRVAILRHVAAHRLRSIRALAEALGRDYPNVRDDVAALKRAGLLGITKTGIKTDESRDEERTASHLKRAAQARGLVTLNTICRNRCAW